MAKVDIRFKRRITAWYYIMMVLHSLKLGGVLYKIRNKIVMVITAFDSAGNKVQTDIWRICDLMRFKKTPI